MTCLQRYTSITSIDTRTPPPPIHPDRQSWWLLRWFGCDHFANQLPLGWTLRGGRHHPLELAPAVGYLQRRRP